MPTIVTLMLIYGAGLHYLVLGLPGLAYGKHIEVIPVGWRELSAHITETANAYRRSSGGEALIVAWIDTPLPANWRFTGGAHAASGLETREQPSFRRHGPHV